MLLAVLKNMKIWVAISLLLLGCHPQSDETTNVAVATNFYVTAQTLEREFEKQSDYEVSLISGSTGQLYAQIKNGAPHDIFLSADQDRAQKLVQNGLAKDRFTYAIGRLVLWSPENEALNYKTLNQADYRHLAIANPSLAPYGRAAQEIIEELSLSDKIGADKIVMGENIGQVYSLVKTGNAELGFVALSQVTAERINADNYWPIPASLHNPIIQDAVMLNTRPTSASTKAFYNFLKSDRARDIIHAAGYDSPDAK